MVINPIPLDECEKLLEGYNDDINYAEIFASLLFLEIKLKENKKLVTK